MKSLASTFLMCALAACHSRDDRGPFRVDAETIAPLHANVWQRMLHRKPVLLTFDDGPEDLASDRAILATLARHHARAIWLVTCKRLDPALDPEAAAHRVALQEVVARGHVIGNHGYSHLDLRKLRAATLAHEIGGCSDLIRQLTGTTSLYFRPPFGLHTPRVDRAIAASGMQLLLWSGNSYDSLLASFRQHPETFASFLNAHPVYDVSLHTSAGDVLLFHDYPDTALALDGILTRLEQQHFEFVAPAAAHGQ